MKTTILSLITLLAVLITATQKIEFEAPEAYPEGITFNPKTNTYFVSSARLGNIGEVTADGKYTILHPGSALKSSYGLKIHPDGKTLYACVGDANYSKFKSADTDKKMARLVGIDIKSGKKVVDVDLSGLLPGKHFANDLTFDKNANAYITDSFANAIYKVTPDGKASVFAKSEQFNTEGVGLNGIVWHSGNFLLVASSGKGCIYKISIDNPTVITRIQLPQFFMNADGLLLTDPNTLVLVQNGGTNRIWQLASTDNWKSAVIKLATALEDRFAFPSTATANKNQVWVMNAKFNELNDSTAVPSKKFSIQKADFVLIQ